LLSITLMVVACVLPGTFASAAFAKEAAVKTTEKYTVEPPYEEAFIFGAGTLYCKGVHKTNSLLYPGVGTGSGSRGGEDVEHCGKKHHELIGGLNHAGGTVNIDGNFWISDFDGQGSYFVNFEKSKVAANGKSFTIVVVYPLAGLVITDLQEIAGSETGLTREGLTGEVGQTVDYSIAVRNNGWAAETLSGFVDGTCDPGTIAGGPGASPLAVGATTTYTCDHVLTASDLTAGSYSDVASVTATPPGGHGPTVSGGSNSVSVSVVGE
jgi:hypothetical protein